MNNRMQERDSVMPIEFDIKITDKDMYRFNMHHAYTGFQGIFATVIGISVFVVAILTMGKVDVTYTLLYFLFGIIFLIYMPVSLRMRSKRQILASPVLAESLHYKVDEEGVHVSVGEQNADLAWSMVYKMISTRSNLLIYSSRVNAYVIPLTQLGDRYEAVKALAETKLEPYRRKLKQRP